MWQERQTKLLNCEIEAILGYIESTPRLHDLVKESLTRVQRELLSTGNVESNRPWPLLPLMVCEIICGKYEQALPAAAGLQLLRASAEVFDDIEDADSPTSLSARYGPAIAINIASTLLILAERAITKLELRGIENYTIIRIIDLINSHYTTACAGQHLDLSLKTGTALSEDTYFNIVKMKSASAVECACQVGALLGNASEKLIDAFGNFGQNLGIASQIADDILGVTQQNDIIEHKITLPVIYALSQIDNENCHQLEQAFQRPHTAVLEPDKIRGLLFSSGAIQYATIKMELYKQRAQDILSLIQKEGVNVRQLQLFLK
jgi:geranylgeranyl pyrophosphate synthase